MKIYLKFDTKQLKTNKTPKKIVKYDKFCSKSDELYENLHEIFIKLLKNCRKTEQKINIK